MIKSILSSLSSHRSYYYCFPTGFIKFVGKDCEKNSPWISLDVIASHEKRLWVNIYLKKNKLYFTDETNQKSNRKENLKEVVEDYVLKVGKRKLIAGNVSVLKKHLDVSRIVLIKIKL